MIRLACSALFVLLAGCATGPVSMDTLSTYIEARLDEVPPAERVERLQPLADEIAGRLAAGEDVDLIFICTHNSRRSHLAQIWAWAGAQQFGLDGVHTWSGGTEATAFNPRAVAALERAGFEIERGPEDDNPVYTVQGEGGATTECFSKEFRHPENPMSGFVAVMTCSDADEACPIVPGAAARFGVTYVDPKQSDGTAEETATYDARCAQIAREMLWVMRSVANLRGAS